MLPSHALFVPPDSSYSRLAKGAGAHVDTAWQQSQRSVWETHLAASAGAQASTPLPLRPLSALRTPSSSISLFWLHSCDSQ